MRSIPTQGQTLTEQIGYEFDVASQLKAGDSIASAVWSAPAQLTVVGSDISGTKVTGYLKDSGTAVLDEEYLVTFKVTSVGVPTPEIFELSFAIKMVRYRKVQLI